MLKHIVITLTIGLLLTACLAASPAERASRTDAQADPTLTGPITDLPKPANDLGDEAYSWRQLLERDAIAPIYEPEFVSAAEAPYDNEELVIGVSLNGQAKAYAIGPLHSREMVNDVVGGVPILVSW